MTRKEKLSIGFLFDDTLDSSDGVSQYVKTLGSWLSSQGHAVSYLVGETRLKEWSGGTVYSLAKNIKVSFNGNRLSAPIFAKKKNIDKIMKLKSFDILHVQMPYSPFLVGRVIKACPPDVAIIGTFHIFPSDLITKYGGRLLRLLQGSTLSRINRVVSVSSAAAEFAREGFKLQTTILPNVVDLEKFRTSISPKANRIVFLGRLVERKGCQELLEAFQLLHIDLPETRLIIAGQGPLLKKLEKYVDTQGLKSVVEFTGYVEERDKPRLLAEASIACFPSLYGESFGIVLIEAMAARSKIVLGGDNEGYKSVLGEQKMLLINPTDTKQFAQRLKLLLTEDSMVKVLHSWQLKTVKQYDINTVGPQLLDAYQATLGTKESKQV